MTDRRSTAMTGLLMQQPLCGADEPQGIKSLAFIDFNAVRAKIAVTTAIAELLCPVSVSRMVTAPWWFHRRKQGSLPAGPGTAEPTRWMRVRFTAAQELR
jgi:hypothetical protein